MLFLKKKNLKKDGGVCLALLRRTDDFHGFAQLKIIISSLNFFLNN